ncbi:AER355Cp [Eremothecium gossypii ATCC 10895]|uniref:AER355Cp n=1 Tax=Eremothecium gossypii (strain ATCC 10895 / CBS 109.51 / FGSC 9923 / NRRL Y-1056) TaxID=284811 RepID=Q756B2_EREGS|nr:AER355Cp [Eremothecium gossypii ATCC 10895]AAS53035.1 AER355Cp [Eremothecium gossypii ATCC 10895]AEY97343.1 FAER355Cp [Eremothecium gossypii FDAG1]
MKRVRKAMNSIPEIETSKVDYNLLSREEVLKSAKCNNINIDTGEEHSTKFSLIKKRRLGLLERAKEVAKMVEPIEFESYRDYFILHTFKRGKSESGRVDLNNLKRYKCGVYYERIRADRADELEGQNTKQGTPRGSPMVSSNDDLEYRPPLTRRSSRRQSTESKRGRSTLGCQEEQAEDGEKSSTEGSLPVNQIRGDISVDSIIPKRGSDSNVRRSSRLTSKEKERLGKEASTATNEDEAAEPILNELYEVIIPKEASPIRRSDWVLPTRQRYIPEKHQPVKHIPEQVKINELVKNSRIKTILSRFEGGLAGVRTSKTT